jgi:replicative DNA helicase
MVWFIYRGDYYLAAKEPPVDHADFAAWQEEMGRIYGKAELIIAKQRHGATGKVPLRFDSRITKFTT